MPRVSIVTTVYDRVDCLWRCLRSVQRSEFTDYEHLVVSDAPPEPIVQQIDALVKAAGTHVRYLNLPVRHDNWGITPAAVGLRASGGDYVCFLSDDNAFLPNHLGPLVAMLDADPSLGFAYASCLYAGKRILNDPIPKFAHIDLGQPLFRRHVFREYLGDDLPFHIHAWDWALISTLMQRGVQWRHLNQPTFIFRVAAYPKHSESLT